MMSSHMEYEVMSKEYGVCNPYYCWSKYFATRKSDLEACQISSLWKNIVEIARYGNNMLLPSLLTKTTLSLSKK